ncbi:HTTM domain-containing protein [Aquimarina intermedia]|uniref:Vitamin K-dependent gamma-carboxylase-like protein n=1 Tax=Aquimarina intermedia TaxID=350814 RepID=A0A5S5C9Q4_9FLAO|nr:HTTM domain-containing protein [Aquimarina intermedia]TYP76135.1 vitamin K-dependent gamma-carboxylase-like protein [Aquimarina intermedia]
MINRWLFTQIDNSSLIVFRVIFGFLIMLEAVGAIFTGWIQRTLIAPKFTFNFIGLDFLQPLPGDGMYYYYAVLGVFGFLVMIGYKYRWSMAGYTILWAGVYFMQKTSYNNHYYLLLLLCLMMLALPAADYFSVDSRQHPEKQKIYMPRWCVLIIIAQLWIVYTYASVAKLYPDWLDGTVPKNLMAARAYYPIIGEWLQASWVRYCIAYTGILFDLLVIPLLLWRRTRFAIFIISIFFHMFNSIVFQIGIFPYLSLGFTVFFFSKERIHRLFMKRKPFYTANEIKIPRYSKALIAVLSVWLVIQITLPVRHWFIPGDVLWTEEGHRLSWRMMLRGRSGLTHFYVVDKNDPEGKRERVDKNLFLSKKQLRTVASKPDAMWQFAQRVKAAYATQDRDVAVYVDSEISINGKPRKKFIDPEVDLASVPWNYFTTNPWIIKYEE